MYRLENEEHKIKSNFSINDLDLKIKFVEDATKTLKKSNYSECLDDLKKEMKSIEDHMNLNQ